jgi:indole-3-glycerol phosphate synthase
MMILMGVEKGKTEIIAEVKTVSPYGFRSSKSWDELFTIAESVGDIISIHTDARWGGSFDLIKKAKSLTDKPILAKGIHAMDAEVGKAMDAGADLVLVVGRLPKTGLERCLIEPLDLKGLATLPAGTKAVWNSRDLSTGGLKSESFAQARALWKGWLCQASNIRTVGDIAQGADAVLVGSHLPEFADSLVKPAM